jgi:hypothetical protein
VAPGMSSSRSSARSPERQLSELACRGPDTTLSSAGRAEPSAAPDRDRHSGGWEFVAQLTSGEKDFAENAWVNHTLAIGTAVRLNITVLAGVA